MHPLVGFAEELRRLRELTERIWAEEAPALAHTVGTMVELPRACIRAGEIAAHADFFSFGTNDLTQTTLGVSRDDAEGKFLARYLADGVLERNPFEVLDTDGVGDLMRIGVERGRAAKPELKLGICGEHGGERRSIAFCHSLGLDYVSCSPYRVPLARLAAAQAALVGAGREGLRRRRRLSPRPAHDPRAKPTTWPLVPGHGPANALSNRSAAALQRPCRFRKPTLGSALSAVHLRRKRSEARRCAR